MSMHERFIARVVDVFDPEKSGRLKIRIFGLHDDTTRIPDDMLPWARCVYPVTNPVHNGVAGPTTGLIKDSTVTGYFADHAMQVPLIDGSLGGLANNVWDFPKADRGEDYNEVLDKSLPSIGVPELKFVVDKTIASIPYLGDSIKHAMDEVGEGDFIDAIYDAKKALSEFNNLKNNIVATTIDQIGGIVQAFASDATNALQQVTGITTTNIGTLVNNVESTTGTVADIVSGTENSPLTDTINNIAGNIATRTSKTPITTTQDALTRIGGHQFVMNNVMPHLDTTLNKLLNEKKNN